MTERERCWFGGPAHDWVLDGDDWECDRCGAQEEGSR